MPNKVTIRGGGYEAVLFPEAGGALVTLRKGDWDAFWPCESAEEAMAAPTRHGLPCLFPPNRIDEGRFTFDGRLYRFTMKEPNPKRLFSHGFLYTRPWQAVGLRENEVTMRFDCDERTDFYPDFPHAFRMDVRYTLTDQGLIQEALIENRSADKMPVGLGWHTAFLLPLSPDASAESVRMRVSVGRRVLLDERMLPTGETRPLNEAEKALRDPEGQSPLYKELDDHFTAEPIFIDGKPFHGAILEDGKRRILYEADPAYRHWMLFNAHASGNLICIEPQNWRINAPNLPLSYEESGLDVLAPGESKRYDSRIQMTELELGRN